MNKKNAVIGSICALLIAGVAGAGVWYSNNNETAKERAGLENKLQSGENTTVNVEVPTENPSAGVYEIKSTPSDEAVDEALYEKIATLNAAADSYYEKNRSSLLCVYGLMYSDKDNYSVSASKVAADAGITVDENIDDYTDVLLIKPSDLSQFDGIDLKREKDNTLKPFIAYNSINGYIISSIDDKGGILTKAQYKSLLGTYATDHGNVKNPSNTDEEYLDIAATVATAFGEHEFDIKYIACDDKYAVAVIGGISEPNNIKEYVLIKKPGGWSIYIDKLETAAYPRQEVNGLAPDMELGLLPKYTIAQFGEIKTGFVEYEQSLVKLGLIGQEDMPETYSCGAGRFAYIELTSGKKLLGIVNESKQLEFYEVNNTNEAINAMLKVEEKPPVFILHYNE